MTLIQLIEDRSYKTYKARLRASERLRVLGHAWNLALVSLAFASATAAIGLLSDPAMYGAPGPTYLAVLAVLSLVVSLVVASQNFGARSRDMVVSYRRVQRISSEAEAIRVSTRRVDPMTVQSLLDDYNDALDESENHTTADFERSSGMKMTWARFRSFLFLALPVAALVVPILVLIPFVAWVLNAIWP